MFPTLVKPDPTTVLVTGILCCLFSALVVFGRKLRLWPFIALLVASCLLPVATVHYVLEMPIHLRWLLPFITAATIAILIVRSNRLTHFLRSPVICGALLFVFGVGMLIYAYQDSEQPPDDMAEIVKDAQERDRQYVPADGLQAATDRGNPIPLFQVASWSVEAISKGDQRLFANQRNRESLLRVAAPSAQSNCHGWVFAGGLCWLSNDAIEVVLVENGYQQVDIPVAGDVVIYRDEAGKLTHSALVRAVWSDGRILVESKWGTLGAFLHFVEQSIYGAQWTFHRTQRPSHLLRGLPTSAGATITLNPKS